MCGGPCGVELCGDGDDEGTVGDKKCDSIDEILDRADLEAQVDK